MSIATPLSPRDYQLDILELTSLIFKARRDYSGSPLEDGVEWTADYDAAGNVVGTAEVLHALAVVLTQDCDLEQDRTERAKGPGAALIGILLCPAWPTELLRERQAINRDRWLYIRNNKNDRYQYVADVPTDADGRGDGLPALLIDFKSYFTVRTIEIYRQFGRGDDAPRRRSRLESPWLEHLQSRFAAYLSRVALPRDHFVPEARQPQLPPPPTP